MKQRKNKLKKKKIKPKVLPNGDIMNCEELMEYDLDNDPVLKAKLEKAKENLRKYPWPDWVVNGKKKRKF